MWWADGFPSHSPSARWHRCFQSGNYGFVLDTETMQIPHFGPLDIPNAVTTLPPAQLGLRIVVDGKTYECAAGGKWTKHGGPRLIESGRFFQRGDVTDLVFTSTDEQELNVEARFETAAWSDRLGLIFAARPAIMPIEAGEKSFGRIGGGFGLDGTNHLEVKHSAELDSKHFTIELWAYVPHNYQASEKTFPWLVCKDRNEEVDGNFGIIFLHGRAQARLNIGGGRDNAFTATADLRDALKLNTWNHLAISYDGDSLRLYVNGRESAKQPIGRKRVPSDGPLTFGRRQDNSGDGYHFRGVIDESTYYDRALSSSEILQHFRHPDVVDAKVKPTKQWRFRSDGVGLKTAPRSIWKSASLAIGLRGPNGTLSNSLDLPTKGKTDPSQWNEVSLAIDPIAFEKVSAKCDVNVRATEIANGEARPVKYNSVLGWHRINLDGIEPIVPNTAGKDAEANKNNSMERIKLVLSNPSDQPQIARLMFEKTSGGIKQHVGSSITGVSAVLRDAQGHPTGIPVQLSKNWHTDAEAGTYRGDWFHGISQVRLLANATVELELSIVYGHWGGVAAASHTQLCLIGWGSNQRWDQSALGAWGESICYEPDQVQANCSITDVRPLMVRATDNAQAWRWTCNVGGGDYFRMFDPSGNRVPHTAMKTTEHRQGPCLTEVTFDGHLGSGIRQAATVSLSRTDDLVRGTYRLRMAVKKATDFSRLVIFQIGADTYSSTGERKMAIGDTTGLLKEWNTQWGGNTYRTNPVACTGRATWVSLHDAVARPKQGNQEACANRGVVIRSWKARLGGKDTPPWIAEHGVNARGHDTSTIDFVAPPGITRLEPGDFVDATIEHIVMPQFARNYYGPNEALRSALAQHENTWQMIHREAVNNDRKAEASIGKIQRTYPDVRIHTLNNEAKLTLSGGLGYVPITFTDLSSPSHYELVVDGHPLDQSVHGNDFWQTEYDATSKRWSQTYNLPAKIAGPQNIHFRVKKLKTQ
ncbi:hypothetical protein CA13_06700 [Planctomycetes bacterium CA13]|uniref:LamG-like jellyroll fold domain-containing protein n=2 Tax=Novipirellula herctigrandis TaxID=2527986 RepID=A0A5C5YW42_9BACT|nr:hypothetical protein CA13_06700 [Planctomycetes bacterium CA13]